MKTIQNKQFQMAAAVFLLVMSAYSIGLITKSNDLKYFLYDNYEFNSSNGATINMYLNSKKEPSFAAVTTENIPIFKSKKQSNRNVVLELNLDFTTISKSCIYDLDLKPGSNTGNDIFPKVNASYSYNQEQKKTLSAPRNRLVSSQNITFQTNQNAYVATNGIQSLATNNAKFHSNSNPTLNSFLENNTLTISTDMTDNNSPMLIDGDTSPGDPGVPVGDGTWILLGLGLAYYWIRKLKKPNAVIT